MINFLGLGEFQRVCASGYKVDKDFVAFLDGDRLGAIFERSLLGGYDA